MSDFNQILIALGRGIIKLLIAALVGFGVGLLVIGVTTAGRPQVWETRGVPGELLIGIGGGLLAGGVMLLALFLIPWMLKRNPPPRPTYLEEPLARPAPPRAGARAADDAGPPSPPRVDRGEDFYEK